jgi:protein-L-isoaspartate(D-aspartate) O-methyltransferase
MNGSSAARRGTGALTLLAALALVGASRAAAQPADTPGQARARAAMVEQQIIERGVSDPRVLDAMRTVPRHHFVPAEAEGRAYNDHPLPIGEGQTISQPYIVALMTELLGVRAGARVLEVGTGSGYQAAVLAALDVEVYTIEIKRGLFETAERRLQRLGYAAHIRNGDGYYGWKEAAPFDGIIITAAVDHIPPPLLAQLAAGGRIVLPLGSPYGFMGQTLVVVTRAAEGYTVRQVFGVRFVPMTGRAEQR